MTRPSNTTKEKQPFVSTYDPTIFNSPIYNKTSLKPGLPVHNLVDYKIKLTVTLKDIGLEGLDVPYVKRSSKSRKRDQKRNERLQSPTKTNQNTGSRVITFQEDITPVPEGDVPFEEQVKRDNENRFVKIKETQ